MGWLILKNRRHEGPFDRDVFVRGCAQGHYHLHDFVISLDDLKRGEIHYRRIMDVWPETQVFAQLAERKVSGGAAAPSAPTPTNLPRVFSSTSPTFGGVTPSQAFAARVNPVDLVGGEESRRRDDAESTRSAPPRKPEVPGPATISPWAENAGFRFSPGAIGLSFVFVGAVAAGLYWKPKASESSRDIASVREPRAVDARAAETPAAAPPPAARRRPVSAEDVKLRMAPRAEEAPPATSHMSTPTLLPESEGQVVPPPPVAEPGHDPSAMALRPEEMPQPGAGLSNGEVPPPAMEASEGPEPASIEPPEVYEEPSMAPPPSEAMIEGGEMPPAEMN